MAEKLHYLVCGADAIRLPQDKRFTFGRAKDNDIVISEDRASRQHAELYWEEGKFVLADLNSNNGTFVNEQRVDKQPLKDDDQIKIGSQTYVYRAVSDPGELQVTIDLLLREMADILTVTDRISKDSLPDNDFTGDLNLLSVVDISKMIEAEGRSGMLSVWKGKKKAVLYFQDGRISGAECGDLAGDEAAPEVLKFKEGEFSFRNWKLSPERPVTKDTRVLLQEAEQ